MTEPVPPPNTPPWHKLATAALWHATEGRWERCKTTVERIATDHGPDAIIEVILAWMDTAIVRTYGGHRPGATLSMSFHQVETGHRDNVDSVDAAKRWAGRAFMARAVMDADQFRALVESVQTEDQWSANVWAVLNICSAALAHPEIAGIRRE